VVAEVVMGLTGVELVDGEVGDVVPMVNGPLSGLVVDVKDEPGMTL
jgi:hypothetical protein